VSDPKVPAPQRGAGSITWAQRVFPVVTAPRPPDDATRKSSFQELVEPNAAGADAVLSAVHAAGVDVEALATTL